MHKSFQFGTKKQLKNVPESIKTQMKFHFEETENAPTWPTTSERLAHVNLSPTLNERLSCNIILTLPRRKAE